MERDYEENQHQEPGMKISSLQNLENLNKELENNLEQSTMLRLKYPGEPLKFYPPEESINDILDSILQEISTKNYPFIASSHIFLPLLKVLEHPNCDLIIKAIGILHEFIVEGVPGQDQNAEVNNDNNLRDQMKVEKLYEIYFRLCLWLEEKHILTYLAALLGQSGKAVLDQNKPDQYEAVLKILKIFQTMFELHQKLAQELIVEKSDPKILTYLCDRIMPNYVIEDRILDDNKFIASDVLVQLMTQSPTAQKYFLEMHGVQILVECLRPYTEADPTLKKNKLSKSALNNAFYTESSDEYEYVSNLFVCLNIVINADINEKSALDFHIFEGGKLMLWFIKQKNDHSILAFKVMKKSLINLRIAPEALSQQQSQPTQYLICEDMINLGLLKYLFAVLMRQGLRGKDVDEQLEIDQDCLATIYYLCKIIWKELSGLDAHASPNAVIYRDRLVNKFQEDRFKKLEQLFQMYDEYSKGVAELTKQSHEQGSEGHESKDATLYFSLMKEGQPIIELATKIWLQLLAICTEKYHLAIRRRIIELLKLYNISEQNIIHNLKMHLTFLTDVEERPNVEKLLASISTMLSRQLNCDNQQKQINEDQGARKQVKVNQQSEVRDFGTSAKGDDRKIIRPKN